MNQKRFTYLHLILIVSFIILIIIGAYLLNYYLVTNGYYHPCPAWGCGGNPWRGQTILKTSPAPISANATPISLPSNSSLQTSTWKIFLVSGISFKYPQNLLVAPTNGNGEIASFTLLEDPSCKNCSVIFNISSESVSTNSIYQVVDQKFSAAGLHAATDFQPITIGGEQGLISMENKGLPAQEYGQGVFAIHHSSLYSFRIDAWQITKEQQHQAYEMLQQILYTVTFIK